MEPKRFALGVAALVPAGVIAWLAVPFGVARLLHDMPPDWPVYVMIAVGLAGGMGLALAGFWTGSSELAFAGAGALLCAAVPLMLGASGFGVLVSVVLVVVAARLLDPPRPAIAWIVRGLVTLLVAAYLGLLVAARLRDVGAFAVVDALFLVAVAAFLAAAWWPWHGGSRA